MYILEPPDHGPWVFTDFPEVVEINGLEFIKAERKQPYAGVIEQYRQATSRESAHMMVLEDGNWIIDHVDEYNPDLGHPVRHFLVDHPIGRGLICSAGGIVMLGIAVLRGRNDAKQSQE
jgi:hypothetical protein